nr:NAD(P)-dependent oxidoreductase [Rhizobium halophytocola]
MVSGGTGLVGRHLVPGLQDAGHAVTVGGRRPPATGLFDSKVDVVPLLLDADRDQSISFEGMEAFVHLAFDHQPGRYRGGEGDDADGFSRRNLDGSVRLFDDAKRAGVRHCIFLSSRAVYDGLPVGSVSDENCGLAPTSLYGKVKLGAEQALRRMSGPTFGGISLRATGIYGPLQPNKWDVLAADYLAGQPVATRAGTEVHAADILQAVLLLLACDPGAVAGRRFNLSDIVVDRRDILEPLKIAAGCTHPLPQRADTSRLAVMDTAAIRALGWRPGGRDRLTETLAQLVPCWIG